jgi:hypothetical protein
MYYVIAIARDYNIAISNRAGAPGGSAAFFNARLENCTGPFQTIDCNITIDFDWDAGGAGSGTGQVTIFSGSSGNSTIPAPGNPLTSIAITNISSNCTNYNSIQGCPAFSNATTTTTTTTSTTSTTTTIAPASYSDPIIKHDQYSSSFGAITVSVWENVGSGGPTYKQFKTTAGTATPGGSGTGTFLGLTGSLIEESGIIPTLYGDFINLYNTSFSYAVVFRIETPFFGYTISNIQAANSVNGFSIFGGSEKAGNFIRPYFFKQGSDPYGPRISISSSPKWYLGVLTFDKTQDSSNCAKFYLNLSSVSTFSGLSAIPSPSTFFTTDTYSYFLGTTLNPIKLAAAIFWQNTVLTQAQIQSLYNEYNARYTLG